MRTSWVCPSCISCAAGSGVAAVAPTPTCSIRGNKALTEQAEKRLQAVFEATELGAGYYIAMKDLEIRGAGNLLGVEQSGHIGAIGFDLYCRILATAVEDAKAEQAGLPAPSQTPVPPPVTLDLRLAAYLPEDYVPDLDTRLEIYRRLAAATELAEAEEMEQELYDRFGPLPVPAEHLLLGVRARVLARRAGVESISRRDHEVVIQLLEGLRVDSEALRGLRGVRPGSTQVRATATEGPEQWGPVVEQALSRLAEKGSEPRPSGSDGPQSTPRDAKPVRQGRRPSRH